MKSRNLKIFLILIFIIFLTGCRQKEDNDDGEKIQYKSNEYLSWSVKMADSEMERRGNSLAFGGSNPKAKWQYTTGLFLKSMLDLWQVTNDSKYFEYVKNVMDSFIEENGSIKTYKMTEYNLDKINPGKVLLSLYKKTGSEKYKLAADILYQQLQNQPRTLGGGFWHKQIYPWQMW
ncbi:MAG: glycoside hydrolase family 88 protein, partial [Calditrichaceae bacterium]